MTHTPEMPGTTGLACRFHVERLRVKYSHIDRFHGTGGAV